MRFSSILALFFISGVVIQPALAQSVSSNQGTQSSDTVIQPSPSEILGEDSNKQSLQNDEADNGHEERQPDEQTESVRRTEVPQSASQWLAELQNIITNANFQVSFVQTVAGK